jgi:hypothetical protein
MTQPLERHRKPRLRLVRSAQGGVQSRANGGSRGNPPVREDKIALARRRMAEGYYDRPDVLERIAEGILRQIRPAAPPRVY